MPFTTEAYLPSTEELAVPELDVTSAVFRAASTQMGKYCDEQCKEFMLCRNEERDPRKCLNEGKEVTRCGFEFLAKVKKTCFAEFNQYMQCLDFGSDNMHPQWCRKTQSAFNDCIKEKMGQDAPEWGYFTRVRLHESSRPKPHLPAQELPEPVPDYPGAPSRTQGTGKWM